MQTQVIIRQLGLVDYQACFEKMKTFTKERNEFTPDEIWLLSHPPVFTLGQQGKIEHIHNPHDIPIINTDRGGQVTYHGPGQIIAYALIDCRRQKIAVRQLVNILENSMIQVLKILGIEAYARKEAPGVYIHHAKIGSLGLRIRKGCSYHGLALNTSMDLTPFTYINPCGMPGLTVTQIKHFIPNIAIELVEQLLIEQLRNQLAYNHLFRV